MSPELEATRPEADVLARPPRTVFQQMDRCTIGSVYSIRLTVRADKLFHQLYTYGDNPHSVISPMAVLHLQALDR